MVLCLIAALLLFAPAVQAQCCGDCNADGEVTINELITAVNNALGQCDGSVTPTPTGDSCPIDFGDDNTQEGTADCYYIGRWNTGCGAADLESLWRSDGDILIVNLLGFDPGLFIGADVTGSSSGAIIGWFTEPDASDLTELGGTITLGANGATLAVDPDEPPFDVDECAFAQYRGALQEVVPPAAPTAARVRAPHPAALTRLHAAAAAKRPAFRRR